MTPRTFGLAASLVISSVLLSAQTKVTPPDNNYSVREDVQMGREAAAQARRQLPIMEDGRVTSFVDDVGHRLVAQIPPQLQHPEFQYSFETVNVREINAFALPGGPMFVNRGMIEAAQTEGEVAGVMAHELSHVVLRHGTAQASKATKYQIGELAGAVIGAIIGGPVGSVVAQGTQFGIGTAFLRFSREYERQADIQGAQIMAAAGYDPRDMANMFRTIEKQGGSGGPEWLSDHPNPGNRSEYINKEAAMIRIDHPIRNSQEFQQVRAYLRSLPKAPTTEAATKSSSRRSGTRTGRLPAGDVERPSSRYTEYREGDAFRISVPSNWRELAGSNSVTFAPEGAYDVRGDQAQFSHGIEAGISRNASRDVETAADELIDSLARANPGMGSRSAYRRLSVDGHRAVQTTVRNRPSDEGGRREIVQVTVATARPGEVFYAIAVAPEEDFAEYQSTFSKVISSVRLND
jgi:Zn-dependent protease with chaperone function